MIGAALKDAAARKTAGGATVLCASCDRCRSRKTKCDGKTPCGNCANKYMRKNKLSSIEGVDLALFDCVYSPAKRRGPVPGRAGQARKASEANLRAALNGSKRQQTTTATSAGMNADWSATATAGTPAWANAAANNNPMLGGAAAAAMLGAAAGTTSSVVGNLLQASTAATQAAHQQQQQQQQQHHQQQQGLGGGGLGAAGGVGGVDPNLQQQLSLLQQLSQQQQQLQNVAAAAHHQVAQPRANIAPSVLVGQPIQPPQQQQPPPLPQQQQQHLVQANGPAEFAAAAGGPGMGSEEEGEDEDDDAAGAGVADAPGIPRTILSHTHLLERGDAEGSRLHAYFKLSIDELFQLPSTPTDEEYCATRCEHVPNMTPSMIPGSHLAALSAARFAEIALGAIVHNEVSLAMELCNAVVHCLRESVQEPVEPSVMYEVAKAYFLLGVFRACRGDMERYFKYRRVCLTYLSKLNDDENTSIMLAAVSYLDSWAYMIYNANEKALPNVDETIPRVHQPLLGVDGTGNNSASCCVIASDPKNQNWIQGAPPVYLNKVAPLHARALDALACAVRSCCDQANARFAAMAAAGGGGGSNHNKDGSGDGSVSAADNGGSNGGMPPSMMIPQESIDTPTTSAVMANEQELCSRNIVMSAHMLMQQQESNSRNRHRNVGLHMVISAMDAFLENKQNDSGKKEDGGAVGEDEDEDADADGGFTDSQIQSLLSVCNTAVENPCLLHHAGPTYHMVTNAAVLLCHLLNGMHAMRVNNGNSNGAAGLPFGPMECTLFEEAVDVFCSVRKLLTIHRRKLPVKLRCHAIPRPTCLDGNYTGFNNKRKNENNENDPNDVAANGGIDDDDDAANTTFVDLGETLLCTCRGCQGFVLMACSPCVAAERARSAAARLERELAEEAVGHNQHHQDASIAAVAGAALELTDKEMEQLAAEFDLDDDSLLNTIGNIIAN